MFQSPRNSGGFDATEDAFCFGYYDSDGGELCFQLELSQIAEVVPANLRDRGKERRSLRSQLAS